MIGVSKSSCPFSWICLPFQDQKAGLKCQALIIQLCHATSHNRPHMHQCGSLKNSTIRLTGSYSRLQLTMPKQANYYNKLMLSCLIDNTNKCRIILVHLLVLCTKLFIQAWILIILRVMLSYLQISPQRSGISRYLQGVNSTH